MSETTVSDLMPKDVTGADIAFGPRRIADFLPPYDSIPAEFRRHAGTKWNAVVSDWFFFGLKNAKWAAKPNVNANKALAHIKVCMASWEPKHEHKEAGCAYLMSLWFEDVTYERGKVP